MMNSIRKWLYKPKKTDSSLLAQFYFADEELNAVAAELDSFDSRKDPERCTALVTQLRGCQDKVLNIIQRMMNEAIPYSRTSRDFRVKFPDDVVQENLAGQLWFGAECLAAGSSIMNREIESASMRPLARALTKNLDSLRCILREQSLSNIIEYTERIQEALTIFDKLFADFELRYVSAMVPVKSVKEYETIQEITVLFSETVIRAKKLGYITTDMIDEYDPALMFTIPRLAIVCGLLIYSDGPLNPDSQSWNMSDMFRPFQTLLYKIRELLYTLSEAELLTLERALCSQEEPAFLASSTSTMGTTAVAAATSDTAVQTDDLPMKASLDTENTQTLSSSERSPDVCQIADLLPQIEKVEEDVSSSDSVEDSLVHLSTLTEFFINHCHHCVGENPPEMEERGRPKSLNKCDSNDSGLHSDVISNSDSLHTMSSSNSHQLLSHSTVSSPPMSPFDDDPHDLAAESSTQEESHLLVSQDDRKDFALHRQCASLNTQGSCMVAEVASVSATGESAEDLVFNFARPSANQGGISSSVVTENKVEEDEEESFYSASPGDSPQRQLNNSKILPPHIAAPHGDQLQIQVTNAQNGQANDVRCLSSCDFSPVQGCCDDASGQHDFAPSPLGLPRVDVRNGHYLNRPLEDDCMVSGCIIPESQDVIQGAHVENMNIDRDIPSDHKSKNQSDREETNQPVMEEFNGTFQDVPLLLTSGQKSNFQNSSVDRGMYVMSEEENEDVDMKGEQGRPTCECGHVTSAEFVCDSSTHRQDSLSHPHFESRENSEADVADLTEVPDPGQMMMEDCSQGHSDRCTQTTQSAINNSHSSKILHHHHHHHHFHHHHHHHHHTLPQHGTSGVSDEVCSTAFHAGCNKCEKIKASAKELADGRLNKLAPDESPALTEQAEVSHSNKAKNSANSLCNQEHSSIGKQNTRKREFAEVDSSASSRQCTDNSSNCSSSSEEGSRTWSKKGENQVAKDDPPSPEVASASSGCEAASSASDCEWEGESCSSSETSSYNSECHDDEEIALAVQAAELASRNQARARFRSSSDMIHRLFVCISGVADQLQTNFAGDLRNILRVVFNLHCSEPVVMEEEKFFTRRRHGSNFHQGFDRDIPQSQGFRGIREPPPWIPDDQSTMCMSCKTPFTFVRRRHHCRNCGKIFCGRCSSNAVSLPHFGHSKPVRVCNRCFMFQVTPFTMQAH